MRKLAGFILIVFLLLLVSYFVTGIITERTLKKDINLLNQHKGLQVNLKKYNRGWFKSDASFDWLLVVPARTVTDNLNQTRIIPAKTYTIVMPLTIYHGPVLFTNSGIHFGYGYAKTSVQLPDEYLQQFNDLFTNTSTKPTINLSVLVNYLNRTKFSIVIPNFKVISKEDGSQFEWQGMKNDVLVSSNLGKIIGDLEIEGFKVSKDNKLLHFSDIESDYNLHKSPLGLYLGKAKISCDSIVATEGDVKKLNLEDFELNSESDVNNGLFKGAMKLSFDKLAHNNKIYGPLLFKMKVKNLDAEILNQINNKVSNIQTNNNQIGQQILWTVLPDLPRLFNKGATFEIEEAKLKLPEGNVNFKLLLKLEKGDLDNPMQLLQKLKGNGDLIASKPVVNAVMYASIKQQLIQKALNQQTKLQTQRAREKLREENQNSQPNKVLPEASSMTKPENIEEKQADNVQSGIILEDDNININVNNPGVLQINYAEIERQTSDTVNQKINSLIQSGVLLQEHDNYVIRFKFENGELLVNDRPFNSSMLTL